MKVHKLLEKTKEELILRNYSQRTISSYLFSIKKYLDFNKRNLGNFADQDVRRFLLKMHNKGLSSQTINLHLNAIKFFNREILKQPLEEKIKYAKRSKRLPVVLSRKEISAILRTIKNLKHRFMLAVSYGSGLRVSEVINLRVRDLDAEGLSIHIKSGKGKKDRITILPESLVEDLKLLMANKSPSDFVFESERGGKLTTHTAQKVFSQTLKKAGVDKPATFHSLRHSFATHLLENGVDIRYIQELLGHQNIQTTQIYTKVTNPQLKNIKSPLT